MTYEFGALTDGQFIADAVNSCEQRQARTLGQG